MSLRDALVFDAEERPVQAADAYEQAIAAADVSLEAYLNLAVLYFECLDFGYVSYHRLGDDFVARAARRMTEVLDEAQTRFGQNSEIEFWRRYFRYVHAGAEPFVDACRTIAASGTSLVPYFYLFAATDGQLYRQEAGRLFESVALGKTARERHIKSVLNKFFGGRTRAR